MVLCPWAQTSLELFVMKVLMLNIDLKENYIKHGRRFDGKEVPISGRCKKERRLLKSSL